MPSPLAREAPAAEPAVKGTLVVSRFYANDSWRYIICQFPSMTLRTSVT